MGATLDRLDGRPFRVYIELEQAQLYALRLDV